MREHAIPQDITGYRFHIIGNMTIKQFAEIGAGVMIGVGIYATNLPQIIKWFFIVMAVGMGALAAFVPIEERPFDHWIVTFFKVLYKPTKFFWRRHSKIPDPFLYEADADLVPTYAEVDLKPARRQRIKEYLTSVERPHELNQFDTFELNRLQEVMIAFNTDTTLVSSSTKLAQKPDLKIRIRSFRSASGLPEDAMAEADPMPVTTPVPQYIPAPQLDLSQRSRLTTTQVAEKIIIPDLQEISIEDTVATPEEVGFQNQTSHTEERAYMDNSPAAQSAVVSQTAVVNANLPFPLPPTEPNKLVGMVLTPTHDLLNDAIVEIQTENGQVARAVKTNALGQFFITTPLDNGNYTMIAEKDGYQFNPLSISLTGEILPPLEIRSA